jgi:cobalt-zinc-cadmium efflux system membrane fusion protein
LAEIFSPELAEAQASYVSARAELDAHDRELARMEKLVQLGSVSRQELERVVAEHTARRTAVQSGASRLKLLGVSEVAIEHLGTGHSATSAILAVPAPLSGVVTERPANVGLNVDSATLLATIVDLSTVWVMADVYERDFGRVRVGMPATITAGGPPQLSLTGKVTYIDPQVNAEARTAKARVEVPNLRQELRLGMLADVRLPSAAGPPMGITVPRKAVQNLFDRSVVYVVNPANEGEFLERTVRLGDGTGDAVVVLAGLESGDVVVSDGSFHVRAERERLGLGEPGPIPALPQAAAQADTKALQTAKVTVTKDGFEPSKVTLRAGTPARLTFVRTTDQTCATEVAMPSLKIKRPLPLNKPVAIEFTPAKAGTVDFVCGMGMFKGNIVVE